MQNDFEWTLIAHCAATLAGHKCANLFCYRELTKCSAELCHLDARLSAKGVRVRLLKNCREGGLVYVYRPARLQLLLQRNDIQTFLMQYGYTRFSIESALEKLSSRLSCDGTFPHEIGVFLDYPLADVIGFIEHRGADFCCLGCWKAYSNEQEARRIFALYHKCRKVYLACYHQGFDVLRLTVAA